MTRTACPESCNEKPNVYYPNKSSIRLCIKIQKNVDVMRWSWYDIKVVKAMTHQRFSKVSEKTC